MARRWIMVDCEAPFGVGSPAVGDMTEFGAVDYETGASFHGIGCGKETFEEFETWMLALGDTGFTFWSDNPAYDWQWINFYFWKHLGRNPFGFSARRIGDFYAGVAGRVRDTQTWKKWRQTPHDHNPVNDARGNVEAMRKIMALMDGVGGGE